MQYSTTTTARKITLFILGGFLVAIAVFGVLYFSLGNASNGDTQAAINRIAQETEVALAQSDSTARQMVQVPLETREIPQPERSYPRIEAAGVSFESPWGTPQVDDRGSMAQLDFSNGVRLVVSSAREADPQEYLQSLDGAQSGREVSALELFQQALGEDFGEYEFTRYMLESTPESISKATSVEEARTRARAVVIRTTHLLSKSPLHVFKTNSMKGFQAGAPSMSDPEIVVALWDARDWQHTIFISDNGSVTQDDIDVIISTIRSAE